MTLVRRNQNWPVLSSLFNDEFLNDFTSEMNKFSPAVNIRETEDSYSLEMSVPGMDKKDFEINVDGGQITISAKRTEENEEHEKSYTRREFKTSSFSRSFSLPEGKVDENKIEAGYKEGILNITIPKKKESLPQSKIISVK